MRREVSWSRIAAVLLVGVLVLAGCSSSDSDEGTGTGGTDDTSAPASGIDRDHVTSEDCLRS